MLKAMLTGIDKDGKAGKLVLLGLSYQNLAKLKSGEPIEFAADEFGFADTTIVIFAGKTEQSMGREIANQITPETKVKIDPRLRD